MPEKKQEIGCVIMASGLSERYGRNKLLEKLAGREVILHTVRRKRRIRRYAARGLGRQSPLRRKPLRK